MATEEIDVQMIVVFEKNRTFNVDLTFPLPNGRGSVSARIFFAAIERFNAIAVKRLNGIVHIKKLVLQFMA